MLAALVDAHIRHGNTDAEVKSTCGACLTVSRFVQLGARIVAPPRSDNEPRSLRWDGQAQKNDEQAYSANRPELLFSLWRPQQMLAEKKIWRSAMRQTLHALRFNVLQPTRAHQSSPSSAWCGMCHVSMLAATITVARAALLQSHTHACISQYRTHARSPHLIGSMRQLQQRFAQRSSFLFRLHAASDTE